MEVIVEDKRVKALVNTGCTTTLITPKLSVIWSRKKNVAAVYGREVGYKEISTVELTIHGVCLKEEIINRCFDNVDNIIKGIDLIIRMNLINQLGGVIADKDKVEFGRTRSVQECAMGVDSEQMDLDSIEIKDKDFYAKFEANQWVVEWFREEWLLVLNSIL